MLCKSWNNKTIRWREDGHGCLTDMANANGKRVGHWLENKKTAEYISELSAITGKPTTDILQVVQGGDPSQQGTWGSKQVCIRFAQWCSAKFAVQVDMWVEEIMTFGYVDIRNMSQSEIILAQAQRLVDIERQQKEIEQNVTRLQIEQIEVTQKITSINQEISDLIDRNSALEAEMGRIVNPYGDYVTVMGYANRKGIRNLTCNRAAQIGRNASEVCRNRDIPIEQVKDPRFGYVGSYPEQILEELYDFN